MSAGGGKDADRKGAPRWLRRTGAVVTALAGILAGIFAIVMDVGRVREAWFAETGPDIQKSLKDCLSIELLSPNLIPHYLLDSIGASENFPYWLKVVAKSECDERRILSVRFERGENIVLEAQSWDVTIESREQMSRAFSPDFVLGRPDTSKVKIHASIEDERGRKIARYTIDTVIVPPHTMAWDLEKPGASGEREAVDREYLLASLAAWTRKPARDIVGLATECRKRRGHGERAIGAQAIKACYTHLFGENGVVAVLESAIRFPDGNRQVIRPLRQVIEEGVASALEAALLFCAVIDADRMHAIDPDMLMIVAPAEQGGGLKTVFAAWHEKGQRWRGVDMRMAGRTTFDANLTAASAKVDEIMKNTRELRSALEKRGAGLSNDGETGAVLFRRAAEKHGIQPLPR